MHASILVIIEGKKQAMQSIIRFYLSSICSISCVHVSVPFLKDYTKYYSVYACKYCNTTLGPVFVRKVFKKELEEKNISLQIPFTYDD